MYHGIGLHLSSQTCFQARPALAQLGEAVHNRQLTAEQTPLQEKSDLLSSLLRLPLILPSINPTGKPAASRDLAFQPFQPDQPVFRQGSGSNGWPINSRYLSQPPGATGGSLFQQQIKMPTGWIIWMTNMLKQHKPRHQVTTKSGRASIRLSGSRFGPAEP